MTVEPAEVLPGAQVTVRYDLGGDLDDKCTGLTVGLQGAAKYGDMQYQSSYDNKTGSYEEVTVSQEAQDGLTFEDVPVAVRPGDAVTGHVDATLAKAVYVKDVSVRLERRRSRGRPR